MAKLEVDQSVRIEELNRDTIIGIGGKDFQRSYRLPRKIKRYFNEQFRRHGKQKRCAPSLFAAAVVLALSKSEQKVTNVIIDTEYLGYETLVRSIIARFYPRAVINLKPIGKLSPAHQAAYGAHLGRKKIHGILTQDEIETIIFTFNKKDGWRTPSPGMNRDSKVHNQPVKHKATKKSRYVKRSRIQ